MGGGLCFSGGSRAIVEAGSMVCTVELGRILLHSGKERRAVLA